MSEKDVLTKTSIRIPAGLWREVKVYAAKRGLKIMQVVEDALRRYLSEER
jgi:predicted DNA binding CopG/RHH family protein